MRVLNVNKFYYRRGGAETVFFAQAEVLRQHGHDVIPFAMHHPSNLPSPFSRYFVSNVELRDEGGGGPAGRLAAAGRILYSREAAAKIADLARDTRPDIAHLHNVYHQLSPSILRALDRAGVPAVMSLHDYKLICPAYTLYANGAICERCRGRRFYNALLQGCVKGSRFKSALCMTESYVHRWTGAYEKYVKLYIAPSRFLAGKVVEFGLDPRRVVYVPNCVEPAPPASDLTERYFLYAGRLERVKGVRTLLEAVSASDVARAHELWIAGDGEDRGELEAYCRSAGLANVRFLGHLSPADLEPVLQRALFAVAPSEWYENAPLSVLEAAGRGKAVIVSDLGGLPETVIPGETGLVFRAGSASELRAAIERLLRDPETAREMGRKARAFINETFSPERHYRGLMDVYGRVLGGMPLTKELDTGVAS